MLERIKLRFSAEEVMPADALLLELLRMVGDRICLRVGEVMLPHALESICVDAALKAYRRQYFEGVASDGIAQTRFVDDILAEYAAELFAYGETAKHKRVVRFL